MTTPRALVLLPLCVALLGHPCRALADAPTNSAQVEEASARFERGLRFYEEGDFGLALIEFERAHQLVADYRLLYNIGQVSIQLGRFARARLALERYAREGGAELPAERRELVDRDLAMLRDRTAHLTIQVAEPGASILVDDVRRDPSPWTEPLLLDAGEHRIVVEKAGFEPFATRVTLAGAEDATLEAPLVARPETPKVPVEPLVRPVAAVPPPASDAAPPFPWRTTTWIAAGVFGAAATATAIVGFTERSSLDAMKNDADSDAATLGSQASKVNALLTATDVFAAGTVALAAFGLYLEWAKPRDADGGDGRSPAQAALRVDPTGVSLRTSF